MNKFKLHQRKHEDIYLEIESSEYDREQLLIMLRKGEAQLNGNCIYLKGDGCTEGTKVIAAVIHTNNMGPAEIWNIVPKF